ncbi:MAG TPA: hypothetical protein VMW91_09165 [Desulfosporosinus sp.]|nr:hypothetical protein [Desulfosporosinus sp.]
MREFKLTDIGNLIGNTREATRQIIVKFAAYMNNPAYVDSERVLIKAYLKKYRAEGKHAARKEVARRIKLGKEIRKLREMYLDKPGEIGYYPSHGKKG